MCPWTKCPLFWTILLCTLSHHWCAIRSTAKAGIQHGLHWEIKDHRGWNGSGLHVGSSLQWGFAEGWGLAWHLSHASMLCQAVLLGTRATCNKFIYFIYKTAYFRPASANIEWHCAHVLINTLLSCNASLRMVFMCNQMRHMSERWQWNPKMSYICF